MLKETKNFASFHKQNIFFVSSAVEWLKYRAGDQYGMGSKSTGAFLWCLWERHFTALSLLDGLAKHF